MLSFIEMTGLSVTELDRLALVSSNRPYGKTCQNLANALRALATADKRMAKMWLDAAKKTYENALALESDEITVVELDASASRVRYR